MTVAAEMQRTTRPHRIVVLVSGGGSNLQAVLDACQSGQINGSVAAVVSNRAEVFALQRAAAAGVPAVHLGAQHGEARHDYDSRLADVVAGFQPDVIVLAGWLRILTTSFLGWFPGQVVNLHPALPGDLVGMHAIERAWAEAEAGTRTESGVMIHLVPDEGVDDGPVLATETVPIDTGGTLAEFEAQIHSVEHRLLVRVLSEWCHPNSAGAAPAGTPPEFVPTTSYFEDSP